MERDSDDGEASVTETFFAVVNAIDCADGVSLDDGEISNASVCAGGA